MDESDYSAKKDQWWKFSTEGKHLLTMSTLPLLDGFFIAYLVTGLGTTPWQALTFGLTAFSGAGCVIAAINLRGNLEDRFIEVVKVYLIVGIGALVTVILQPFFKSLLPENMYLFTGIFLLGLGFWTSDVSQLRKIARWMNFDTIIKVMLVVSAINGLIGKLSWEFSLNVTYLPSLAIMLLSGFALTTSGMFLGMILNHEINYLALNLGAGVSLVMMGLTVLGLNIPVIAVISPLLGGCVWTVSKSIHLSLGDKQIEDKLEVKRGWTVEG